MKAKAPLYALADTVAEVEAETLYETLSNIKAKMPVQLLDDMLAKAGCRNNW